jgi:hypothetical protein
MEAGGEETGVGDDVDDVILEKLSRYLFSE